MAEKSNEIVAIPALLDMMAIEGAVVTIDAMGCQRNIAKKIIDKKADYIIALKGNQGTLHEDVKVFAAEQKANGFKDTTISRHETVDGDHGRIETRTYTAIHDVAWLQERHDWPGLKGVVMVESQREIDGKVTQETRFYITSLVLLANVIGPMIRDHWAIENSLHWVMDMVFRDDECRVRTEHAPANFTTLKHMAHNLIKKTPGKELRTTASLIRQEHRAYNVDLHGGGGSAAREGRTPMVCVEGMLVLAADSPQFHQIAQCHRSLAGDIHPPRRNNDCSG